MSDDPLRRKPGKRRPAIWASGGQRPPFDLRALGRATLHLSREGIAPIHAWAARGLRRAAVNVKNGAGRIPAGKLGRVERFVPSHLRVAAWVKNLAATLSHASATADEDVTRGNALVAEIAPHLWGAAPPPPAPEQVPEPVTVAPADPSDAPPVVLAEPEPAAADPLAAIRDDLAGKPPQEASRAPVGPALPPAPPGPVAEGAIQVSGYLIGWASVLAALPYGLVRSLWLWANGRDLKTIDPED
ncbi:hypothetical protein [Tabrizicola sp.]|uniref:hypothetical protein n=1 Tax=Tabrizicola sp. TaxID=2005166 RepID=UPI001A50F0F3|nr:hypothetical protein [Tabrizicola sp.]MBL9074798.1 hypothetical protein [Tabrizicola sp.]